MTDAQVQRLLEELAKALTVAGVLPWWAYLLLVVLILPLFFLWHRVSLSWPPGWDAPPQAPPMPVQPDGTIHLNQAPPKEWL